MLTTLQFTVMQRGMKPTLKSWKMFPVSSPALNTIGKSFAQSDVRFLDLKLSMGSIRREQAHTLGCDLKETAAKLHYKIIYCNILYVVHKDALQNLIIKQYFRFYQDLFKLACVRFFFFFSFFLFKEHHIQEQFTKNSLQR